MGERPRERPGDPKGFWRRHIAECGRSGLSYAEYCRRRDLSESAFGYWRKKLSAESEGKSEFIELKVRTGDPLGIEITLRNQIRVVVHSDIDKASLLRLIEVLEAR